MEEQKNIKKSGTKKTIYFIIGGLLVLGTLGGGNIQYITDWSTAELVGFNIWTIIAIFGGSYLIYLALKK